MKEILRIKDFSFAYEGRSEYVLKDIDLEINNGEMLLVCGKSGSGKTTLLRLLKSGTVFRGMSKGKIEYEFSKGGFIGYMPQNAEDGIVTDKVWHELAFGLENQGKPRDYIRRKVAEVVSFFGLSHVYNEEISKLSGGMKQLVLLASVMVMEPEILILDEPLSQLDPVAATDFIAMIKRIHTELETTIIISEHRLSELISLCDRILALDEGEVLYNGVPKKLSGDEIRNLKKLYELMPPDVKIYTELGGKQDITLNVNQCRQWLREKFFEKVKNEENAFQNNGIETSSTEAVVIKNLSFSFNNKGEYVLHKLNMSVKEGEIHMVLGANGSGKTTLLSCIAGVYDRYTGKISTNGRRIALMPQNPRLMFVKETIKEDFEVLKKLNKGRISDDDIAHMVNEFGLAHILDRYPYDLSGGEIQKAGIVKILLTNPDIILMDEPAKGMDGAFKKEFIAILKSLVKQGKTIIAVSHDIEFAAHCADRCTLIFNGDASVTEKADSFFSGNSFYTTVAARIASGLPVIDGAVTEEEIIKRIRNYRKNPLNDDTGINRVNKEDSGRKDNGSVTEKKTDCKNHADENNTIAEIKANQKYNITMTLLTVLSVFILIPLTIWFGTVKLEDRKYFFISLLILAEALLPVFILYEYRQTDLIRLVTDAVLCALTVTGRVVFYMLPNFKPVIAMVIISGTAMGPLDGFIVGAVSMLVSDMFFGQGPWTPWQMLSMGIIGLLSGLLGKVKIVKEKTGLLCVIGALMAIVIFGGIMNPASIIMYQPDINLKMILYSYVAGFPVDCVQAVATVIFLSLCAKPFLRKLDRLERINQG